MPLYVVGNRKAHRHKRGGESLAVFVAVDVFDGGERCEGRVAEFGDGHDGRGGEQYF